MKKIVVVGSINMDYVTHVQQQPGVGETVSGQGLDLKPGGKGANQAYAAAYLGADVTMLGAVGNDAAGRMSLDSLQHAGVHTEYIRTVEGVSTGTAPDRSECRGRQQHYCHSGGKRQGRQGLCGFCYGCYPDKRYRDPAAGDSV